ncbi:group 3 secretory phospholipase A2 [Lucilia cuprina]|uniref:group 3 secretory phospholipase A2 n=1 Tax=Lucilia cuprina TaxID=7375 RepID=UPI001F06D6A2|nr:group 3 secretory phospholipase A2 [Lucilia cuprina]
MKKFLNLLIIVTIYISWVWTIYVPEHTDNKQINEKQFGIEKPLGKILQTIEDRYVLKLNNINNNDADVDDGQQQIVFNAQQAKNAHQFKLIPTQQKSYDIDDDVVVSAKKRTNLMHEKNLEAQPTGLVAVAAAAEQNTHNNDVLTTEEKYNTEDDSLETPTHSRQKRQLSDFLIAPNTRWCGRGNTANGTYNHLGGASMADKCCRTHDHCKVYIPAMSNRFDLFNYRPYTLSHCNCDRRFRTCLKMASDEDANTIGKLFFNLVQTQCFVLVKEVVCQQRAKDGTCLKEHVKQKAYLRNNKKY